MNQELEGFRKVIEELLALKERKAGDYHNTWKAFGIEGLNYQIGRKFGRIWLNRNSGKPLNNESIRDSYVDLAVYSMMAIQLIDEGDTDDKVEKLLKS